MRARTILAVMHTVLALAFAAQIANANRLSTTERRFRVVWTALEIEAAEALWRCPVTLDGSFHSSTMAKTLRALVGQITRASVNGTLAAGACTNGSMTIHQEALPWHVQYAGFSGVLPGPSGILLRLVGMRFRIDPLGILPACNGRTEDNEPLRIILNIEPNGLVTGATVDPTSEIALEEGLCAFGGSAHFGGTGRVTRLGSATANIAVRLI